MSGSRNKLLINLSLTNSNYHNSSSSAIIPSNVIQEITARSVSDFQDVPYHSSSEISSRNISPIISMSETQLNECLSEDFGSKVFTELVPCAYESLKNVSVDFETEGIQQLTTSSHSHQSVDFSVNGIENKCSYNALSDSIDKILKINSQDNTIRLGYQEGKEGNQSPDVHYKEVITESVPCDYAGLQNVSVDIESEGIQQYQEGNQSADENNKENIPGKEVQTRKRKRGRCPNDILEAQRAKHPMVAPCSCKKTCIEKIPQDRRIEIWDQFWSLDRQRRRDFLSRNVERVPTKQVARAGGRRNNTLIWKIGDIQVCKIFFLGTLGYKNDEAVQSVLKNNYMSGNKHPKVSAAPDLRGKVRPGNAFPATYDSELTDYIMKYNPVQSHYNLKHAPNRRYLPTGINFSMLYKGFKEYCAEKGLKVCSWSHFYTKIKSLNLSTAEMAQDICTKCQNHEMEHKTRPLPCNCNLCQDFGKHLENKRACRKYMKLIQEECKNSNGESFVYTVDMQKVICMPLLHTKDSFFSRKLILFNESFVPPGKNMDAVCVVWHEGESGRKAYNIANTYIYVLRKFNRDTKHVYLFLDNCNSQNKNKTLMSALVREVNDEKTEIEKITLVYFEVGHTFMAADAVHAAITKKFNSSGELYDLNDFVTAMKASRKNLHVELITHDHMSCFDNDSKVAYPHGYNMQSLKIIEFRRGQLAMYAKNCYDGDFKEIRFLKKKVEKELAEMLKNGINVIDIIPKETSPRGITTLKKADLITLCTAMPRSRRDFYENLLVSEAPDLSEHIDSDI